MSSVEAPRIEPLLEHQEGDLVRLLLRGQAEDECGRPRRRLRLWLGELELLDEAPGGLLDEAQVRLVDAASPMVPLGVVERGHEDLVVDILSGGCDLT